MIATLKTMRITLALLLVGVSICASAQTTFSTSAQFVEVNATQPESTANPQTTAASADPRIFWNAAFTGTGSAPYAGAVVDLAGVAPQAQITGATLYAYALKTGVYQHISARFRFWNAYQATTTPVFAKPVEFVAEIASCPCNFVAGRTYGVYVSLPKPVYTEGIENVGFSQVWEVSSSDEPLIISSDLVPALDASSHAALTGQNVAAYGSEGRSPDDLDFVPTDELTGNTLVLELRGTSLTLDQCTGAANFQDQFSEEFDDASAFYQRWKAYPNNGTFTVGAGYLALSAPDSAHQFPYIASGDQSTVIPPTGDFEVRWRAVFAPKQTAGDGEMVISNGKPLNGNNGDSFVGNVLRSWQDAGGLLVHANTSGGSQNVSGGDGTSVHDMEYCWVNGNVELWKDGARIFGPSAQPVQRPDSIWFGNSVTAGGGPWNAVTLYRVLVRGNQAAIIDHIFSDGFGPPSGE
jgi:hypothetical protein